MSVLENQRDSTVALQAPDDVGDSVLLADRLGPPPGTTQQYYWIYVFGFSVLHLACFLALVPWLFSWWGVASVFLGNLLFGAVGINLAYHRLLTHRGLTLPRWLERTFVLFGVCSLQDAPARWVAIHRMHHQHSDHEPDPHTPWVTFFWGHMGWLMKKNDYYGTVDFYDRYARDVIRDPFYRWLERGITFLWIYVAHAVLIFAVALAVGWFALGGFAGGLRFALSILVWGVVIRTVYVWHITWAINSGTVPK